MTANEASVLPFLEAARARWPGVAVEPAAFARYVDERAEGDEPIERLELVDLYLACACAAGDARAIDLFDKTFLPDLTPTLARVDGSPDFIEEARQRVRERLFVGERPRITEYAGKGPLGGWLRVVALRTALNMRRSAKTRTSVERLKLDDFAVKPDLELAFVKERFGGEIEGALERAMARLTSEQRHLLRMHYLDRVTMDDIAQLRKVNRSTVSRWLSQVRSELLEGVKQELSDRVKMNPSSMASVLRVVGADLEISLRGLLKTTSG